MTGERATAAHHRHRQLPVPGWLEFASQHLDAVRRRRPRRDAGRRGRSSPCTTSSRPGSTSSPTASRRGSTSTSRSTASSRASSSKPRRRAGSGRRRTTSAASTRSPASCAPRAGSARRGVRAAASRSRRPGPTLKASVPGPYTLSGRLCRTSSTRTAGPSTEALLPIVRAELEALVAAGCREITRRRAVDELLRPPRGSASGSSTSSTARSSRVVGKCRLSTHLCFGNYKARAVGPRRYAPMFPAFLDMNGRRDPRRDGQPRVRRDRADRARSPSAWTSRSASST